VTAADHRPSGFFVLRTPLLPVDRVLEWSAGLEAPARAEDPATLEDALAGDRLRLRTRLEEIVTEPSFREAVFTASPSLEAAIDTWRKDPDGERGLRAEASLVAYLMRASARATPFGLFAGYTTGSIGSATRLRLAGTDRIRRRTRLDMDYLWRLAKAIEADPGLRAELRYRPNSSLYRVADRLLYAEERDSALGRSYHLVAVGVTPYLTQTLTAAAAGERLDVLADGLATDGISRTEAMEFLGELIGSQLLVADCQPPVTGPPPAHALVTTLASHPATAPIAARLGDALAGLAAIDAGGLGASPASYRQIAAAMSGLPVAPDPARFVHVDLMTAAASAELGPGVVADILRGAQTLHALTRQRADPALASFREQFTRRYETRQLPLAQVLDTETGIGFGGSAQPGGDAAPLLATLPVGQRAETTTPVMRWTGRDAFLYRLVTGALAAGQREISVSSDAADALLGPADPPLPDAFEVLATIVAGSPEAVECGDYQVLIGAVGGPSGVRLVGRFCHADGELRQLAMTHLRAEERTRPGAVFAEVVHLPQGRTGNILSRPVLRDYEIPYLGRSGLPASRQLPISDLLVSVQGERIVLTSRRLGREVIPRLTAAHNYSHGGLDVYKFLCALQHQDVTLGAMWDWGPLRGTPFLPRVVSGRAVLSRMTWNLGERDLAAFTQPRGAGQYRAVQELRARLGLPRHVALADADNELACDLDNLLCVEALAHQLRRRTSATLVELLPGPGQLCVSGPEGRFTHQILVPFVRGAGPGDSSAPARPSPPAIRDSHGLRQPEPVERRFPPGSEWLYLKLFTGQATVDRILAAAAPLLSQTLASGEIDGWHFVRYHDPDWHLRLRLHGRADRLLHVLPRLRELTEPLVRAGLVWRVQLDTYEREIERYGGPAGIEHAERIFHADSAAVLDIIRVLPGDAGAELRWQVALRGIDQLLTDLGLTPADKRELARGARRGYGTEFGTGGSFAHAVGARFRRERPRLEAILGPAGDLTPELAACARALDYRSAAITTAASDLRALCAATPASMAGLAMSLAHMHVNRLLRSAQRAQELVLYEMLDRLYTSQAARTAAVAGQPDGDPGRGTR
jgi:lantibiotic biosynthesis protein